MHLRDEISQSALARISGVPQPTINRILKGGGKKGPETATVKKLAEALRVRFEWLMEGRGPMEHSKASEAPGRSPGWSELVRVDEYEYRVLRLIRQLDERGKVDAEANLEEAVRTVKELAPEADASPADREHKLRRV